MTGGFWRIQELSQPDWIMNGDLITTSNSTTCEASAAPLSDPRLRSFWKIGAIAFYAGLATLGLLALERTTGLPIDMPDFWYGNRGTIPLAAIVTTAAGLWLLRRDRIVHWQPSRSGRRFQSAVLYTRGGCHLCDVAKGILHPYRHWLPPLAEVDIDEEPELMEQYSNCVPVLLLDGRVRFRGRIDETLLRRLIEGTPPA